MPARNNRGNAPSTARGRAQLARQQRATNRQAIANRGTTGGSKS